MGKKKTTNMPQSQQQVGAKTAASGSWLDPKQALNLLKKWGPIGVATHYTISLSVLGIIYAVVRTNRDVVQSVIPAWFQLPPDGTDFVVSMALHKLSLPVRVPISLLCVPRTYAVCERMGVTKILEKFGMGCASSVVNNNVGSAAGD